MKHTLKAALIEPVGGHGGMSQYDLGLCRGLVAAGWRVSWYTCAETGPPNQPGVTFCPVYQGIWGKSKRWRRAARYLHGSLKALGRAVREGERICHLHFFNGAPEELMLLLLCRLFGRKIVLTVHDIESFAAESRGSSRFNSRIYPLAERLVVHNETSRRELVAALHVPEELVTVIPHGNYVDTLGPVPGKASARANLGLAESSKVILFFGQIKAIKGLDLLLEAMPAILGEVPEAILLIAGRPWKDDFTQYAKTIQRLAIGDRCLLHIRYIPDEEVSGFYACADVVVLPYRRIYQSGVLLLAMSYQRAAVASDLSGMMDVVKHGQNGYAFSTSSAASLAETLIAVLKQDEERDKVAARAYAYVTSRHDWRAIGAQLAALYAEL